MPCYFWPQDDAVLYHRDVTIKLLESINPKPMNEKITAEIAATAKAIHENNKPNISMDDITSILCTGAQIGIRYAQEVLQ